MKWRYRNGYMVGQEPLHTREVIKIEIASCDRDGQVEALQSQVDKLTDIVGLMLDAMSDETQRKVIANLYGWEEVK